MTTGEALKQPTKSCQACKHRQQKHSFEPDNTCTITPTNQTIEAILTFGYCDEYEPRPVTPTQIINIPKDKAYYLAVARVEKSYTAARQLGRTSPVTDDERQRDIASIYKHMTEGGILAEANRKALHTMALDIRRHERRLSNIILEKRKNWFA